MDLNSLEQNSFTGEQMYRLFVDNAIPETKINNLNRSTPGFRTKRTVTSTYTASSTDAMVLVDATAGNFAVTLPSAKSGSLIWFKKLNSTNTVTITRAGSDTIEGSNTMTLTTQYSSVVLVADGTSKWLKMCVI